MFFCDKREKKASNQEIHVKKNPKDSPFYDRSFSYLFT